jgi:hypothetical protein
VTAAEKKREARKISDVMERIRPLLVTSGVDMTEFKRLEYSLGFAAPETHPDYWRPLCEWLASALPNPTLPDAPAWVKEVSDIIEGRS